MKGPIVDLTWISAFKFLGTGILLGFILSLFVIYEFKIIDPGDAEINLSSFLSDPTNLLTAAGVAVGAVAVIVTVLAVVIAIVVGVVTYFGYRRIGIIAKDAAIRHARESFEEGGVSNELVKEEALGYTKDSFIEGGVSHKLIKKFVDIEVANQLKHIYGSQGDDLLKDDSDQGDTN
jgi:hypothetical protein